MTDQPPAQLPGEQRAQIDQMVALLRDVLGADLLGAYLYGSAVLGGLRARSDLDVLAVARRPMTRDEQRRLVDGLLELSPSDLPPGGRRRLELTIVVQSEVRPWRYPPSFEFQYGNWLRPQFEAGDLQPWPSRINPDLAALILMALQADHALVGPPSATVLDAPPEQDIRRAMADEIPGLVADLESDTRNVLLTLARMWTTAATGEFRSKDGAADWALARLPPGLRPPLDRARAAYLGTDDESWDDLGPQVRALADAMAERVRALSGESADPRVAGST